MRTRARFLLTALATLPALAACDESPTGSAGSPSFVATVRGSVQDDFRGTGQFHQHPPDPAPPFPFPGRFTIGAGSLFDPRSFTLFREGPDLPAPGTYPLASSAAGNRRFVGIYTRRQGDDLAGFTSTGGELRITVSTPDRIEGTFRFQGIRNCAGTADGGMVPGTELPGPGRTARLSCTHPVDPTQPAVEVTGSFVVVDAGSKPPLPF